MKKGASYGCFNPNKPIDLKLGFYLTEIIEKAKNKNK
jgi:hypothetical protein